MIQDLIHKQICRHRKSVDEWFQAKRGDLRFPFYSSFDIRDSSFKVVPVDANIFPAGFNNICQTDKDSAGELVRTYLDLHYPSDWKKILLLTEEHTNNPYYWDNVATLLDLLQEAGREVRLGIPRDLPEPITVTSASGREMRVFAASRDGDHAAVDGMSPDLIISNNDFSEAYMDWMESLKTPVNPPHELGWHRRRKDSFFKAYNQLADEFARLIEVDPWHLQVETRLFNHFDITNEESRQSLARDVDEMLKDLKVRYQEHQITAEPYAFVKNNAGTYGLAVIQVHSGEEVMNLNYKSRKKMKAAKGGRSVEEVIIQEGVPTVVTAAGDTAEPAIYMIGCQLAGGFLRTHGRKSAEESLNSPGAVYKRLCVSDLNINIEGCPMENVYGWVAKLGFLAIAREAEVAGVEFRGYSS